MVKAVPEGMHTITPQLAIDGCDQAIDWYKKAFGAELCRARPIRAARRCGTRR